MRLDRYTAKSSGDHGNQILFINNISSGAMLSVQFSFMYNKELYSSEARLLMNQQIPNWSVFPGESVEIRTVPNCFECLILQLSSSSNLHEISSGSQRRPHCDEQGNDCLDHDVQRYEGRPLLFTQSQIGPVIKGTLQVSSSETGPSRSETVTRAIRESLVVPKLTCAARLTDRSEPG